MLKLMAGLTVSFLGVPIFWSMVFYISGVSPEEAVDDSLQGRRPKLLERVGVTADEIKKISLKYDQM